MTHVSTHFNDFATKVEKCYTIEVHTFDGEIYVTMIYAYNAEQAQAQAADEIGNADYCVVLAAEVA